MESRQEFLEKLKIELNHLPVSYKTSTTISDLLLMKDYFARMLVWLKEFDRVAAFDYYMGRKLDGHNVFYLAKADFVSDFMPLEEFANNHMKDTMYEFKYRNISYLFIYLKIYYDIYKNHPDFLKYHYLPNPYKPVIKLLQRGGLITMREGYLIIGGVDEIKKDQKNIFRLPSTKNSFLNYIDLKVPYTDIMNIPNQDEVSQLWVEYQREKNKNVS